MNLIDPGCFLLVAVASCGVTGLVRRNALKRNIVDIPNARSSHAAATPRGGGLAIVLVYYAALAALTLSGRLDVMRASILLLCGATVSVSGWWDDRRSLPASVRFGWHLLAAAVFASALVYLSPPWLAELGMGNRYVGALCVTVALTWSANLFNFMDGIDGIAGMEAVFVTAAGAWINSQRGDAGLTAAMLGLCAASAGFLIWNWPRARIFMGDVGSVFLGLTIPMLDLLASERAGIPLQVWMILGGLFLSDATVTLLRRIARGDRWFEPHRLHAYQHLARRWNSHLRVTLLFAAINVLWLLPWAWCAERSPASANRCMATALLPVVLLVLAAGGGRLEAASRRTRDS